jgi:uncharacterized protein with PIN domain
VIILDSSILVGLIKGEEDAEQLIELIASENWAVGAPTLVETRLVRDQPSGALLKLA